MRVLITTSSFGQFDKRPLEKLKESGCEVVMNPFGKKLSSEECYQLYTKDIQGVIAGTEEISAEIIHQACALKVISRCGVGLDNVDTRAAQSKNISIFKTSMAVAHAVAELTVGLMLSSLRFIPLADRAVRQNKWVKPMGYLLQGKTVGLIGLGSVGKKVVELLQGFNYHVQACDELPDQDFAGKFGVSFVSLEKLMKTSDIVSVHLPYHDRIHQIINAAMLGLMKPDAFLVNTSRGEIVDEQALWAALESKKIAGAALDVFTQEPYAGPLKNLDNVILTSHIGSYARETRVQMEMEAVENLLKGLESLTTPISRR